jgi:hypothetical protein
LHAFPKNENASLTLIQRKIGFLKMRKMTNFASKTQFSPELGSGKHFHALAMRAIDISHDFTPKNDLFEQIFFVA